MNLLYHLRIYRRENLVLPAGLWGLFVLMVALMHGNAKQTYEMANAFLGFVLPLMAGILAASAIVDDSALELQLAAPRAPWQILLERLALLLGIVALAAATFQVYLAAMGVDISVLGNLAVRQLVWLIPSLALMGLGSLAALVSVQGTGGALLVGIIWILQLMLRDWFAASRWARYILLFMGARWPNSPYLAANQLCLTAWAILFVIGASFMLKQEERYL